MLKKKKMWSVGRKPVPNGDGELLVGKQRRMEAIEGGQVARVGNDHCGNKSLGSAQRPSAISVNTTTERAHVQLAVNGWIWTANVCDGLAFQSAAIL
jgi:hypothetical protein